MSNHVYDYLVREKGGKTVVVSQPVHVVTDTVTNAVIGYVGRTWQDRFIAYDADWRPLSEDGRGIVREQTTRTSTDYKEAFDAARLVVRASQV